MKNTLFAVLLFTTILLSAQSEEAKKNEVTPGVSISKVTVYGDRALVERRAVVDLAVGATKIIFDNLPDRTDSSSLQVKGTGPGVLEDIVFQVKYYAEIPDERIRALSAIKDEKERKIRALNDALVRYNGEKVMVGKVMDKVTAVKEGSTPEVAPDKWMAMLKLYSDRLAILDEGIRGADLEISQFKAELQALKKQLDELQAGRQKKKNQAILVVNSEKAGQGTFYLSYLVLGPSWSPAYDLRVDSQKNLMELSYNANLLQNTGEDWNDVALTLSTARVEVGGKQPTLNQWSLFVNDYTYALRSESGTRGSAPAPMVQMYNAMPLELEKSKDASPEPAPMLVPEAQAQSGATAVVFLVPNRNSIASDNTKHRVSLTTKSFPASFRYSAVPKLSTLAYLKAKVKNTSEFPFLAGKSKVFLDGNFVSEAGLDFVAPGEEFWTFLGVDESIKVEYKQIKKFQSEEGLISKSTKLAYEYEINVTNNRKVPAEVVIWDNIPTSSDDKIKVQLLEPRLDDRNSSIKKDNLNRLEWLLNLSPAEKKKLTLSYTVEYPQGLSIGGL